MIKARISAQNKSANLKSYDDTCPYFTWEDIEKEFSWYGPGHKTDHSTAHCSDHGSNRMNIIAESIDRWAADAEQCAHDALVFSKGGQVQTYSYQQLKIKSCQWASLLKKYGFKVTVSILHLLTCGSCLNEPDLVFANHIFFKQLVFPLV